MSTLHVSAGHSELRALSTAMLLAIFVCAWVPACVSAQTWADSLPTDAAGRVAKTSALQVSWTVTKVLFCMWMWLLVVIMILLMLQKYLVNSIRRSTVGISKDGQIELRPTVSKYGNLFSITFGILGTPNVILGLAATMVVTYLFAWVGTRRVMARYPREGGVRRLAAIKGVIQQTMLCNLVLVLATLLISGVFLT